MTQSKLAQSAAQMILAMPAYKNARYPAVQSVHIYCQSMPQAKLEALIAFWGAK